VVAAYCWSANQQEDAVYQYTFVDDQGRTLDGANKYALTFPKAGTPPEWFLVDHRECDRQRGGGSCTQRTE